MKQARYISLVIGGLFSAGVGFGVVMSWFDKDGSAPAWLPLIGLAAIGLGGLLFWLAIKAKSDDPDGEIGEAELFLGDMSDPLQRRILIRVAVAGAVHGILVMRFILGETPAEGWQPAAEFAGFALTLGWIVIECINFHRIDEFWTRIVLVPAALSGVILFFAVTCWLAAEQVLGAPEAPFWSFYLLYYVSLVVILVGRQKLLPKDA